MSTNYYVKNTPTLEQRGKVKTLIDLAKYKEAAEMLSEFLQDIHIGKSSGGWRFLFNMNGGKYYKDAESLFEWIKDKEIIDEYGREISAIDFKVLVDSKVNNDSHWLFERNSNKFTQDGNYEFLDCEFC